ncbi:hypothetical protein ARMGADRAFT_1077797 [Armillaria gallica]|uniref:Uncharacterized protein n=1 Tax=Armillaria gallica TaxID=47427 RepID=A0A2H3DME5_ARMGA|nr:hypothetical protein ARMGADRAFT_1077797 [Armillaria gallica]
MASLVTVELDQCDAEPQDFADMMPITMRKLRVSRCHLNLYFLWDLSLSKTWRSVVQIRVSVWDLAVTNPFIGLDDAHLGKIRSSIRAEMQDVTRGHILQFAPTVKISPNRSILDDAYTSLTSRTYRGHLSSLEKHVSDVRLLRDMMHDPKAFRGDFCVSRC